MESPQQLLPKNLITFSSMKHKCKMIYIVGLQLNFHLRYLLLFGLETYINNPKISVTSETIVQVTTTIQRHNRIVIDRDLTIRMIGIG